MTLEGPTHAFLDTTFSTGKCYELIKTQFGLYVMSYDQKNSK